MHFVQSNTQHVSSASGGFAPDPHRGSSSGPRWGTRSQTPSFVSPVANSWLRPCLMSIFTKVKLWG